MSFKFLNTIEGDGFGIGGFGGLDEPFGSIGDIIINVPDPGDKTIPPPAKGATITGREHSVYITVGSIVDLSRTSHIDTSGVVPKSKRNLIFEGS